METKEQSAGVVKTKKTRYEITADCVRITL
jgi:hypothetical protein